MPRKQKKTRNSNLAVGYTRVSTAGQADEGISLDAQQARLKTYCDFRELKLLEIVTDPAVSGTKPLSDREGGARLVTLLRDEQVAHVVGLKIDRLFRSTMDCLANLASWHEEGIALHLVDFGGQAFDTGSAMGEFFLTIMVAMARWEAGMIRERTAFALERKKELGEDLGKAPYGMRWADIGNGARGDHFVPDEHEQEIVQTILDLRSGGRGMSFHKIADYLNEKGIPARGDRWHTTSVARIIRRLSAAER